MVKNRILYPLVVFVFLFITACGNEEAEPENSSTQDPLAVQQPAESQAAVVENASFHDLDGNEVNIGDFEGKLVLIDFWESWCGPCLQVFPAMQDLREEHPDEFEVLAVTVGIMEGPEEARAFAEKHGYDFNFLVDENGIFNKLGGQGIPFKAVVSPEGKLITVEMGSHGRQGDYDRMKEKINEYFE